MIILHLSTDFPDSFMPQKTYAIRNLVDATADDFDHIVYSLNRIQTNVASAIQSSVTRWPSREIAMDDMGPVWTYDAPGKGLFLRSSLQALAENIALDLHKKGIKPDLVIGHKLSMEGIIAERLSALIGVPFALCLQGNSDRNILNIRRDIRLTYKRIFHRAAMVFPFTPWALSYCETVLGKRNGPVQLLPCISGQENVIAPVTSNGRLMTAFHLRHREIKNLSKMLDAAAQLGKKKSGVQFDIYGGGDDADIVAVESDIAKRAPENANLLGPVAHDDMQVLMNGYAGFTMISRKESFGLVFIEALMAGCPVAYTKDAAIDGYFDDHNFAIAVPANDSDAIADAMMKQLNDEKSLKQELLRWQKSGGAEAFKKAAISRQFRDGLRLAIEATNQ